MNVCYPISWIGHIYPIDDRTDFGSEPDNHLWPWPDQNGVADDEHKLRSYAPVECMLCVDAEMQRRPIRRYSCFLAPNAPISSL